MPIATADPKDPQMLLEPDAIAAAYGGTRRRTTDLLRAAGTDDVGDLTVPACPEWTVTQLAAHVCGVCDDILAGNIAEAGTDPWTADQVASFAGMPLAGILDHWDEVGLTVEGLMPGFPQLPASQVVFDATTHEHDVRGALGEPGGRESDGIMAGLGFLLTSLDGVVREHGLPALGITTPQRTWPVGDGQPHVRLSASSYDVFRSFGGRRSLDQIRGLGWDGDPSPYFVFFGSLLRPPPEPVEPADPVDPT